ncbi:hypothetical protein ACWC9U_38895 [Streptomyces sp. 900116325]
MYAAAERAADAALAGATIASTLDETPAVIAQEQPELLESFAQATTPVVTNG